MELIQIIGSFVVGCLAFYILFKYVLDKADPEPTEEKEVEEEPQEVQEENKIQKEIFCSSCGELIKEEHQIKSFDGKKFHKACFKQLKKEAKKNAFG